MKPDSRQGTTHSLPSKGQSPEELSAFTHTTVHTPRGSAFFSSHAPRVLSPVRAACVLRLAAALDASRPSPFALLVLQLFTDVLGFFFLMPPVEPPPPPSTEHGLEHGPRPDRYMMINHEIKVEVKIVSIS